MALTAQQVQEILADDFLNPNTPEGLLYQVFFRNATNFACRGRDITIFMLININLYLMVVCFFSIIVEKQPMWN